jgi:folylpolyglutamate synthase/dihydrofolate synthase
MNDPSSTDDSSMQRPIKLDLSRMVSLLSRCDPPNPHLHLPLIHVAGTNGKGSVCSYLDSILTSAGYQTCRFNSPHLIEPRDSIVLRGQPLFKQRYDSGTAEADATDERWAIGASPFEKLTALAFCSFAQEVQKGEMDVAIVEVGMGGSEDATNVHPSPILSVITSIDLDHQAYLGGTIEEIAKVKSGIIKRGRPVVVAPQKHAEVYKVVERVASQLDAPVWFADEQRMGCTASGSPNAFSSPNGHEPIEARLALPGRHQRANASTAVLVSRLLGNSSTPLSSRPLRVHPSSIVVGLETARWPGRLDWVDINIEPRVQPPTGPERPIRKKVLVDGAHNPASVESLRDYLDDLDAVSGSPTTTFIVALSQPRDPRLLLSPLLRRRSSPSRSSGGPPRVIATRFSAPELMPWVQPLDPHIIASASRDLGLREEDVEIAADVRDALERTGRDDRVVVCGSLYLAADVYRLVVDREG